MKPGDMFKNSWGNLYQLASVDEANFKAQVKCVKFARGPVKYKDPKVEDMPSTIEDIPKARQFVQDVQWATLKAMTPC